MKYSNAALVTLLATREFFIADLMEITLMRADMVPLPFYTNGQEDLTCITTIGGGGEGGGDVYSSYYARLLGFSRGSTHIGIGLGTDSINITLWPFTGSGEGGSTYQGVPIMQAILNGLLDGARIKIRRQHMPSDNYTDCSAYPVWLFSGRVSEVQCTSNNCELTITSDLELLDRPMPCNLYQPMCNKTAGQTACVGSIPYINVVLARSGSTTIDIVIDDARITDQATADLWTQGVVSGGYGLNTTVRRTIKKMYWDGTYAHLTPAKAFPYAPTPDVDEFTLQAGCDRTLGINGCQKIIYGMGTNEIHFRGFPWIPRPETTR
jgi:hypothetical protein